ncbi:anaerobic typically selenocysteine-containing protein [Methylobacterium gnaphalii]|uniref:anaerobic typically selenocysteine-containing protein n=1 Tax=Methylobacterium gnaphalii TaxID=1010610 RepID=UPI001EE23997|nr:anaerobic typically selenocysteine-containing protein [Methylobacterium gnaphalii]
MRITKQDGRVACSPGELRLPADSNVTINVVSQSDSPVVLTSPNQFKNSQVHHHEGDLTHVASEDGWTVKQNGKGVLKLRTLAAGQQDYGCTSVNNQKDTFRGKSVLSPTSG